MAKETIRMSGMEGLAPRYAGGPNRTTRLPESIVIGSEDQMASGLWDPFYNYGYLAPVSNPESDFGAVTGDITFNTGSVDLMNTQLFDAVNDTLYFGSEGQYIFETSTLGSTDVDQVHDLGSTGTPRILDLENYQINGVRAVFWMYEKAGNMECGYSTVLPISAASGANKVDDWLTSTVSGAFTNSITNDPFMRVADNGFMYIFQDNNIHKVDGTSDGGSNGTVTANILQFPTFFQITDALDTRGRMFIALRGDKESDPTFKANSRIGVYVWDRFSNVIRTRDFIPIEGCRDIRRLYVAPGGNIRAITSSTDGETQIRQFDGSSFKVIEVAGIESHPLKHDSVYNINNGTMWLGIDGGFYIHGSITGREKEGLYKIGQLSSTPDETGVLIYGAKFGVDPKVYYSVVDGNSADVFRTWAPYNGTIEQGDVYTKVKILPVLSTVRYIDIYCLPTEDTGSTEIATIKVYFNQSATAFKSVAVTKSDASRGYVRVELNKPYVTSVQIETEFNTSNSLDSKSDFYPSVAVIDYQATGTKG